MNRPHLTINRWTGNRYTLTAGNPITGIELDGHWCDGCSDGAGWALEHGAIPTTVNADGQTVVDWSDPRVAGMTDDGTTKTFYKPDPAEHGYPSNWTTGLRNLDTQYDKIYVSRMRLPLPQ